MLLLVQFLVDIIIVDSLEPHDKRSFEVRKGDNDVSAKEFGSVRCFTKMDRAFAEVDCTLIFGRWRNADGSYQTHGSLLLARFYNKESLEEVNRSVVNSLYSTVIKECENDGFVRRRVGGSSGLYKEVTPEMFDFMRENRGGCPKIGVGQWWLPNGTTMHMGYINKSTNGKSVRYSVPQKGGQFEAKPRLLELFPFLYDFAECKVFTAKLVQSWNKSKETGNMLLVSYHAVEAELWNLQRCLLLGEITMSRTNTGLSSAWQCDKWDDCRPTKYKKKTGTKIRLTTDQVGFRKVVLANYANFNKHTLVQHPVGNHEDSFGTIKTTEGEKTGIHSLENKVCFWHAGNIDRYGIGRGGMGPNKFVFAILDWTNSRSGARRRAVYNAVADPPRRVTEAFWRNFLDSTQWGALARMIDAQYQSTTI